MIRDPWPLAVIYLIVLARSHRNIACICKPKGVCSEPCLDLGEASGPYGYDTIERAHGAIHGEARHGINHFLRMRRKPKVFPMNFGHSLAHAAGNTDCLYQANIIDEKRHL